MKTLIGFSTSLMAMTILAGCASNPTSSKNAVPDNVVVTGTVEYSYRTLMMRNSDQIEAMVRRKIELATEDKNWENPDDEPNPQSEKESAGYLKDGLRIVFSRPDQDGVRKRLTEELRKNLNNLGAFETSLDELTIEAIVSLRDKSVSNDIKATYIVLLENLMAELRPDLKDASIKKIFERIRDANIVVTNEFRSKQLLGSMRPPQSPSKMAKLILASVPKQ